MSLNILRACVLLAALMLAACKPEPSAEELAERLKACDAAGKEAVLTHDNVVCKEPK
jgi:hypothetical protein